MNTQQYYQTLEANRSPDAILLETINHALTMWFCAHVGCQDEIAEYKTAQKYLEAVAGNDEYADTYLKLTLARDWYRALYGHEWDN